MKRTKKIHPTDGAQNSKNNSSVGGMTTPAPSGTRFATTAAAVAPHATGAEDLHAFSTDAAPTSPSVIGGLKKGSTLTSEGVKPTMQLSRQQRERVSSKRAVTEQLPMKVRVARMKWRVQNAPKWKPCFSSRSVLLCPSVLPRTQVGEVAWPLAVANSPWLQRDFRGCLTTHRHMPFWEKLRQQSTKYQVVMTKVLIKTKQGKLQRSSSVVHMWLNKLGPLTPLSFNCCLRCPSLFSSSLHLRPYPGSTAQGLPRLAQQRPGLRQQQCARKSQHQRQQPRHQRRKPTRQHQQRRPFRAQRWADLGRQPIVSRSMMPRERRQAVQALNRCSNATTGEVRSPAICAVRGRFTNVVVDTYEQLLEWVHRVVCYIEPTGTIPCRTQPPL